MMRILRALLLAVALIGVPVAGYAQTATPSALGGARLPPIDREIVIGMSTRDLMTGGLALAAGTVLVGAVTGSTATAAVFAVAIATTAVIFEPLTARFAPKASVPTMSELRRAQ